MCLLISNDFLISVIHIFSASVRTTKGGWGMVKKLLLVAVIVSLMVLLVATTFKDKTWKGSDFPYIGAFFCHNDDYVRFYCTEEMHRFYYMTAKDSKAYVEFYVDGVRRGVVTELPANKWNSKHFSIANWAHFDLGLVSSVMKLRSTSARIPKWVMCIALRTTS
jgi:hypothetical protein